MSNSIPFEESKKPWFGPRKRAREFLRHRTTVLPPSQACHQIAALAGGLSQGVQRIRFIDFCHQDEDQFRYTIALTWTESDATLRNWLYESAAEIVAQTGWYTLPQGERIGSRAADRDFERVRLPSASAPFGVSGPLVSLASAVNQDGGCSIRCQAGTGSLLLDTGLPGKLAVVGTDRLALLTHSHLDHCGNLREVFRAGLPVLMSRTTARLLSVLGKVTVADLRKHCYSLDPTEEVAIGEGLKVHAFSVPHCPGSTGFTLHDGNVTLVYPGDVVFRTSRHDAVPALRQELTSFPSARRVCLIDATMAGRDAGAGSNNAAAETLEALKRWDDVVLVSNDVEQLLYAYLDLYHTGKEGATRGTVEFAVSGKLKQVFEILHSDFIARNLDRTDPFLMAQYREAMSAWAETRWLFWLGDGCRLSARPGTRRAWLVSADELSQVRPAGKAGVVPFGRAADTPLAVPFPAERLEVDASAWTLHSDQENLGRVVQELQAEANVVLFHNFPRRMKKFAEEAGLSCEVLGLDPISLA